MTGDPTVHPSKIVVDIAPFQRDHPNRSDSWKGAGTIRLTPRADRTIGATGEVYLQGVGASHGFRFETLDVTSAEAVN